MPTILDQATVFDEFQKIIPSDVVTNLRAHIAGPEGELHRYDNAAEKELISVGAYDFLIDNDYDYPNLQPDSLVELASIVIHIDDALLRYFQDLKSGGNTIAPVASYKNRISTNNTNGFKANGASFPRMSALKDRDVAIGDIVFMRDGSNTQTTAVAGFIADPIAASIAAATSDVGNAPAQPNSNPGAVPTVAPTGGGAGGGLLQAGNYFVRYTFTGPFGETRASDPSSVFTVSAGNIPRVTIPALPTGATSAKIYLSPTNGTALQCTLYKTGVTGTTTDLTIAYVTGAPYPPTSTQISGTDNDVELSDVDTTTYNGLATGDITETYTILVTTGGNPASARLQLISASGRDDAINITPAAYASQTTLGARQLKVTFTHTSDDFVIGQTWQLTVRQLWATATPTSGGTFSGPDDITYIATVSLGGKYADTIKPQITVTSAQGTDQSGPTTITAAGSNVAVGTQGVVIQFAGTGLRKGDVYYISVVGTADGAYKTILLSDNLTTALQGSTDMDLTLYLKKNITVPSQRASSPPDLNWSATSTTVTINDGIVSNDSSLTDGGVEFVVPVEGGTIFIEYRAWANASADRLFSAVDQETAEAALGIAFADISPDHVLAYAVKRAIQNSNGQMVQWTGISDPDNIVKWTEMLEMLEGYNDIFALVPLTRNEAVLEAYRAHVVARSDDNIGGEWRHVWMSPAAETDLTVVDQTKSSDEGVVLATLGDNPSAAGTQFTLFSVTTGNGKFITNGVMAGDEVRYLFGVNAFGDPIYTSFIVASVINEDSLLVTIGHSSAVTVAQKLEVHRTMSKTQIAMNMASKITGDAINERFKYVWPDQFTDDDGEVVEGYHLCAIYAAFTGGIAPHQGIRNISLTGVSDVPRSTLFFNNGQLNILADTGFVIASKAPTGEVFTLFARTSDASSVASREEATTRLDDATRYLFWNTALAHRGNGNLTGILLAKIRTELQSAINHATSDTRVERIGSMIESATIVRLTPHLSINDRLVMILSVVRPFPLNDATLTLEF